MVGRPSGARIRAVLSPPTDEGIRQRTIISALFVIPIAPGTIASLVSSHRSSMKVARLPLGACAVAGSRDTTCLR